MSWGLVAAATIGAAGAIAGGQAAARGARRAADTQADAALETARIQEEAQRRFEERMQPYTGAGQAADRFIYGLVGLPAGQGPSGMPGGPAPDPAANRYALIEASQNRSAAQGNRFALTRARYAQMGPRNAELYPTYEEWLDASLQGAGIDPQTLIDDELAFRASQGGGEGEAQTLPAPTYDPETARQEAMAAYEASPWAQFARESAEQAEREANERFRSTAGARGDLVSGRTAAGLYEIAQEAEDERFRRGFTEGWFPTITGISQRGYNAAVGVGDSSLQTAAQIGAAGERAAGARAEGQRAANDAIATGINSALYYAGQGFDAFRNRPPPPPPPAPKKPSGGGRTSKGYYGG